MSKKRQEPAPSGSSEPESVISLSERASLLIESTFRTFLADPDFDASEIQKSFRERVPVKQRKNVESVLNSYTGARRSYRIALIGQLAYGLASGEKLDLTRRHPGARGANGVGGRIGKLLANNHIVSVEDAYQNIGKNTEELARGNFPAFDDFLRWASENSRSKEDLEAIFKFACWTVAATARPVQPMPELDPGKLTFATVMSLFDEMLAAGSGGVHEQCIAAALLEARASQAGSRQHVETKKITVSDQSANTPADIQVKTNARVDEAFEVTANDWAGKLAGAKLKMRAFDLSRFHIVGRIQDYGEMLRVLGAQTDDVSALELRGFIATVLAELLKTSRADALRRLYQLLDRVQEDIDLVNAYVTRLVQRGFAVVDQ